MIILLFYRPHGSMRGLRVFEYFIIGLVLSVVVCFCIQLSLVQDTPIGDVFMGYLPSGAVVEQQGLVSSLSQLSRLGFCCMLMPVQDSTKPAAFLAQQSCRTACTWAPVSCSLV